MRVWGAGRHGAMQPALVDVTTRDHAALPVILPVSHNPRVSEMGGQGKPPCRHGVAVWHRGVQAANGPVLGNEDRPAGQSYQIRIVLAHTKLANGARRVTVRIELIGEVVDARLLVLHGEGEITTVAGVIHDLGSRTAERSLGVSHSPDANSEYLATYNWEFLLCSQLYLSTPATAVGLKGKSSSNAVSHKSLMPEKGHSGQKNLVMSQSKEGGKS